MITVGIKDQNENQTETFQVVSNYGVYIRKRNPSHCHSKRKPRPFNLGFSFALTPDLKNHLV
jgi:hypothetical protein